MGKGGNAGYQHFLLFPQCFLKGFFPRVVKSWDCVVKSFNFGRIRVKMENKATGEGNYQSIFDKVMPLSRLGIFPKKPRNNSRAVLLLPFHAMVSTLSLTGFVV